MKKNVKKTLILLMITAFTTVMFSCSGSEKKSALNPENPVTVTVWNYYNGDQLSAFEKLVDEFNSTVGSDKGIVVVSKSQGDVNTLADSLIDAVDGEAGAQDVPTLASVYGETGYILDKKDMLVSFDDYFTKDELSKYVEGFIEEGRFNKNNDLMLFPVSKSTEAFTVNKTDWASFEKATGIKIEDIKTNEDLVAAAEKYYKWTDDKTPNIPEDGKALYGRDSIANYIYIGSYQLGHEIFNVLDGKLTMDMDRDAFKTLWDNYYIPYINGYFASYANFRSEDMKTGKILALTSSTTGAGYLPTQVTDSNDKNHDVEMYTTLPLQFKNAKTKAAVQQGAGYCILKSTDAQQEGAVEFLKWFTEEERNLEFSLMSGYSPVTAGANTTEAIKSAYEKASEEKNVVRKQIVEDALIVSAEVYTSETTYSTKPFEGSKDVRTLMDSSLQDIAKADRADVEKAIAGGATRKEATAKYSTDEYFDKWFNSLKKEVEKCVKQ